MYSLGPPHEEGHLKDGDDPQKEQHILFSRTTRPHQALTKRFTNWTGPVFKTDGERNAWLCSTRLPMGRQELRALNSTIRPQDPEEDTARSIDKVFTTQTRDSSSSHGQWRNGMPYPQKHSMSLPVSLAPSSLHCPQCLSFSVMYFLLLCLILLLATPSNINNGKKNVDWTYFGKRRRQREAWWSHRKTNWFGA